MIESLQALEDVLAEEGSALFLEPRDTFDRAIIGLAERAAGTLFVLAYDRDLCVQALAAENEWDEETALEFFEYNTIGAWAGEGTPVFITRIEEQVDRDR